MKLHFRIDKNILNREDNEILSSYSRNHDKCIFHCKNKWSDIYKYALFTDVLNKQYIVDLGIGERVKCIIPNEVLKGNYFSVSVFGDNRYTTTQVNILIKPSGFSDKTEEGIKNGKSEIEGDASFIYNYKIWDYPQIRCNRFEIAEHPYY